MKHRIVAFIGILTLALQPCHVGAQEQDTIQFSLLTCGPGEQIYNLFGHTAIRFEYPAKGIDLVFNYGEFDFNAPHFVYRFILGQTDYQLGVGKYQDFINMYAFNERYVQQQSLNLNDKEKERLLQRLLKNRLPENRIYRYNYFYNNCATKPRDQIEKCLAGTISYGQDMMSEDTGASFRELIHQYTKGHLWARFGIDLLIGSKADTPISRYQMMFIPFYVERFFDQATITDKDGTQRPLVSSKKALVTVSGEGAVTDFLLTPFRTFLLLFIIITAITIYTLPRKKNALMTDIILFGGTGAAGCLMLFVMLFSEHPAVSPNYLPAIFNPLNLLLLPYYIYKIKKGQKNWYLPLNAIIICIFIIAWNFIPQKIDLALLPLALCLLERSLANIIITSKKQ